MDDWVTFTRRTNDPKLAWLQAQLAFVGIPSRRDGESFHAPILKVPTTQIADAWKVLTPHWDKLDDDDKAFHPPYTPLKKPSIS